ncbi:MAG: flagellar protein FliS [Clostridiales bacterium]|jgi:flagellar protein FliS|nr:flagellar protein FliS [Clostridiales bacterium]
MKPAGNTYNKPNVPNIGNIAAGAGAENAGAAEGGRQGAGDAGQDGRKYITSKVMSASPAELILMMYEQFFELIPDIKQGIRKKSPALAEPHAERAQAIIDELVNALDFSVDMSKDLGAIYFYVRDRILEANIKFDEAIWDHIYDTMRPLYEGFAEAAKQAKAHGAAQKPAAGGQASIVAGMTYGQSNLKEIVINTKSGLKA